MTEIIEDQALILAAEDCDPQLFEQLHRFSKADEKLIAKLIAHGPVLLRGGRGCGKSALMIEASRRVAPAVEGSSAYGIYLSLRHIELLKGQDAAYERALCKILIQGVRKQLIGGPVGFDAEPTVPSIQRALSQLSSDLGKRIILFFDDAAHLGREASLAEFFDIFRTISSSTVSCKAAIYPGVTRFGTRFDVFNDATVLDVTRSEELPGFAELLTEILQIRFAEELPDAVFGGSLSRAEVGSFLGQAVVGNMRGFVFACNELVMRVDGGTVGLNTLTEVLIALASNHFWPLLEELKPKLGVYEPLVESAREIAEFLFDRGGKAEGRRSVLVHRDIIERLAKPFEMLEYAGFINRREASRSMKSGGRGARYVMNLCNLLEKMPGTRLTRELFDRWTKERPDPLELGRGSELSKVAMPPLKESADLGILAEPVEKLRKSPAYPYGLTEAKIRVLKDAGVLTVGDLASASDDKLKELDGVGDATVQRFHNVVGQAIWM